MKLDAAAAQRGIEERVAKPLGVTFIEAVWGIHDLINENMAAAAKTHIAERGGNPQLVHRGGLRRRGSGACLRARAQAGAPRLVVPPNAGVGSALGFFTAPRAFDLGAQPQGALRHGGFRPGSRPLFRRAGDEGERTLRKAGAEGPIGFFAARSRARFIGQGSENQPARCRRAISGAFDQAALRRRFDESYARLYGVPITESPVEFVNFCVRASLPVTLLKLPKLRRQGPHGRRGQGRTQGLLRPRARVHSARRLRSLQSWRPARRSKARPSWRNASPP